MDTGTSTSRSAFSALLRELRIRHARSLGNLAEEMHFSRGYIGNVEQGTKLPERRFAELADEVLQANGALLRAWEAADEERRSGERTKRRLSTTLRDSEFLIGASEDTPVDLQRMDEKTRGLADARLLGIPPASVIDQAGTLRSMLLEDLTRRPRRPGEQADGYLLLGRLSGILAYAALDLGYPKAALEHTRAAWTCAEFVDDNELRVWIRGTQSLVTRFTGDYPLALWFARDGRQYAGRGTSTARILSGEAQCLANLGDADGANITLNAALDARAQVHEPDSVDGVFTFSEAKQHYYASSSLIWLPDQAESLRAVSAATTAISLWEQSDAVGRSPVDEALVRIYQATALLHLGELDGSLEVLRPVLALPPERRISWIRKRVRGLADELRATPYNRSPLARAATEEMLAYLG